MKEEQNIIDRFGKETPFRVPKGYFESVRIEIESKLPAYPEAPKEEKLSTWMRVRPYVYLAAMFAGIWLMMTVFHRVSGMGSVNLDNPPEQIAQIVKEHDVADPFMTAVSMSDMELFDEVSESYESIEDFEEDFGYELEPEYENMEVSVE